MIKKLVKNKKGDHFKYALIVVFVVIGVFAFAFDNEDKKYKNLTGFATIKLNPEKPDISDDLLQFEDVGSLSTLSTGSYYLDSNGFVYWLDEESRPAVAKVSFIDESQKRRNIYIDHNGNVGYLIS